MTEREKKQARKCRTCGGVFTQPTRHSFFINERELIYQVECTAEHGYEYVSYFVFTPDPIADFEEGPDENHLERLD